MPVYNFTVDAELLRELGERLVGRPHIALAELIKNAYDADATTVEIEFTPGHITVSDNGHGMSEDDFVKRWMRVGTTRKRTERQSPYYGRVLTGSKGVGRLAAQLLAQEIAIESVGLTEPAEIETSALQPPIRAAIDWRAAVQAGDLTDVKVSVDSNGASTFAAGSSHGTRIVLTSLAEDWDADSFRALAEEVWALQPPVADGQSQPFNIVMRSPFPEVTEAFDRQMHAIFEIWSARITGRLLATTEESTSRAAIALPRTLPEALSEEDEDVEEVEEVENATTGAHEILSTNSGATEDAESQAIQEAAELRKILPTRLLQITVEMRDGGTRTVTYRVEKCEVDKLDFSFLVFDLKHRQPRGIRVGEARGYLRRFGGIGIYDNGFRLPYYGAEQDWLAVERDFAARKVQSKLVPEGLRVERGLLDVPRNQNLFGRLSISTNHESQVRADLGYENVHGLSIQVTRDRLADNEAYERLRVMARAGLDLYAMEKARDKLRPILTADRGKYAEKPKASEQFKQIQEALTESKSQIPETVFDRLEHAVVDAVHKAEESEETATAYASVLGALATAGMTSLAYEHEMSKQIRTISSVALRLAHLAPDMTDPAKTTVLRAVTDMEEWAQRAHRIRQVFKPLVTRETRERRSRMVARKTILTVAKQIESLAGGIAIDVSETPNDLLLPKATYPAWSSVFQNILVNSYNAMLETPNPRLAIAGGGDKMTGWLEFRDNGAGVDLATADRLWLPFERQLALPQEREDAGLGGMGLGLTIIKMVADELDVRVKFVKPPSDFNTSLKISWKGQA